MSIRLYVLFTTRIPAKPDKSTKRNEIIDISNENIAMDPFQQEAEMGGDDLYLASNDGDDYVNNANIDDYYMA